MIDTSHIREGQVVKNYKELCKLLCIKPADGRDNRKNQKIKIGCYIEYETIPKSQKIKIIKIKEKPDAIIDGRSKGNHSIYCHYAKELLLNYISEAEPDETYDKYISFYLSDKDIMSIIGLCNNKFLTKVHADKLITEEKVTRLDCFLFYQRHREASLDIIKSSINQSIKDFEGMTHRKGFLLEDKLTSTRRASIDEESELIKEVYKETLQAMEIKNMFLLHVKNKQEIFYKTANYIIENEIDCMVIKEINIINIPSRLVKKRLEYYLQLEQKLNNLHGINLLFYKRLNEHAINKFAKFKENERFEKEHFSKKYNDDLTETEAYSKLLHKIFKLPNDYIEKQQFLSKELVYL